MKLAVYAIAKNEQKHLVRWQQVCREADHIVPLDTGSTDNTVNTARDLGLMVHRLELPAFRFDTALNAALALVPTRVEFCIRVDLDEVLPAGWRSRVEAALVRWPNATRLRFPYYWNAHRPQDPKIEFMRDTLHRRHGYYWSGPRHEALIAHVPESIYDIREIVMTHHPDPGRDLQYGMESLELGVREEPDNPRRAHYLGREYYYEKRWSDAISELQRHLSLPGAAWAPERAASARFIAHPHAALKDDVKARDWFENATRFDRGSRDAWMDLAQFEFDRKNWPACAKAIESLLTITERTLNYIGSDAPWGVLPYDIGAVAAYYAGRHDQARRWMTEALRRNPGDPRLVENAGFILGRSGGGRVDAPTGWMFA